METWLLVQNSLKTKEILNEFCFHLFIYLFCLGEVVCLFGTSFTGEILERAWSIPDTTQIALKWTDHWTIQQKRLHFRKTNKHLSIFSAYECLLLVNSGWTLSKPALNGHFIESSPTYPQIQVWYSTTMFKLNLLKFFEVLPINFLLLQLRSSSLSEPLAGTFFETTHLLRQKKASIGRETKKKKTFKPK